MLKNKDYFIKEDRIVISNTSYFDIEDICECGQLFRYEKNNNEWIIFSKDKKCKVINCLGNVEIITKDPNYFEHYFDLKNSYERIIEKLKETNNSDFFLNAIDCGKGIRIVNQDIFETIVSFIISANNNIKRIQKIIQNVCVKFGQKIDDYYAFPTIEQLSKATKLDFELLGAGYRSEYLVNTLQKLSQINIKELQNLNESELRNYIISLNGVGPKVCDCILLFAFHCEYVFPVDTWIDKTFNQHFNDGKIETNRIIINKKLIQKFGNLSGYAQQYLFNYKRNFYEKL